MMYHQKLAFLLTLTLCLDPWDFISAIRILDTSSKTRRMRISMTDNQCPDIFGMRETFLTYSNSDVLLKLEDFDLILKDRSDTQNKAEGGIIPYFRRPQNCKRR